MNPASSKSNKSNPFCSMVNDHIMHNEHHNMFHTFKTPARICDQTICAPIVRQVNSIVCHYCGEKFANRASVKAHVREKCSRKKYSAGHGCCTDCGNHYKKYGEFVKHLHVTGHMSYNSDTEILRPQATSTHIPMVPTTHTVSRPSTANVAMSHSVFGGSQCSSMASSPSQSRASILTQSNSVLSVIPDMHLPPPVIPMEPRQFLLRFAAVVRSESQVGASAWCLQDLFGSVVLQGAMPVKQEYPSLVRAEFEGMLHGLEVTRSLNVKNLKIQSASEILLAILNGRMTSSIQMMHKLVEDLIPSIHRALNAFPSVSVELVPVALVGHVLHLAENAAKDAVISIRSRRMSDASTFTDSEFTMLPSRNDSPARHAGSGSDLHSVPPGLGFDVFGNIDSLLDSDCAGALKPHKTFPFPSISELSPWLVGERGEAAAHV